MIQSYHPLPGQGKLPFIIAHRGISVKFPENTLVAFERAAQVKGIDMIELDVRLSKDEQVIVLHDRTLQRTTTGNGVARKYTFQEIRQFDAGSWFHPSFSKERVPTLREVLVRVRNRLWVNVEIKSDHFYREPVGLLETKVLEVVQENGMLSNVLFSSFDHRLITNLKRMNPQCITGVIYSVYRDFGILPSKLAKKTNASVFVCGKRELTRKMIMDAQKHNIAIYVYTLDSIGDAQKVMEMGVDGIMSNRADEIVQFVKNS